MIMFLTCEKTDVEPGNWKPDLPFYTCHPERSRRKRASQSKKQRIKIPVILNKVDGYVPVIPSAVEGKGHIQVVISTEAEKSSICKSDFSTSVEIKCCGAALSLPTPTFSGMGRDDSYINKCWLNLCLTYYHPSPLPTRRLQPHHLSCPGMRVAPFPPY